MACGPTWKKQKPENEIVKPRETTRQNQWTGQ